MYPLFTMAGKNVSVRTTVDISEKILEIIKDIVKDPEIMMQIKDYKFKDLTHECRNGYAIAINYGTHAKVIYPEKIRDEIFFRDIFAITPVPKTRLIYIGDFWNKGNRKFYRVSIDIQGKERIEVTMAKNRIYYKGLRVIVFGKREEKMVVQVAGQIGKTVFAYRWYE